MKTALKADTTKARQSTTLQTARPTESSATLIVPTPQPVEWSPRFPLMHQVFVRWGGLIWIVAGLLLWIYIFTHGVSFSNTLTKTAAEATAAENRAFYGCFVWFCASVILSLSCSVSKVSYNRRVERRRKKKQYALNEKARDTADKQHQQHLQKVITSAPHAHTRQDLPYARYASHMQVYNDKVQLGILQHNNTYTFEQVQVFDPDETVAFFERREELDELAADLEEKALQAVLAKQERRSRQERERLERVQEAQDLVNLASRV